MSINTQKPDTSTICDKILKEWSDSYPKEKLDTLLQAKVKTLETAIFKTKEKLDNLTRASMALDDMTSPLLSVQKSLQAAIAKRRSFIAAFGDGGVTTPHSVEDMEATTNQYIQELNSFADQIRESFLKNLSFVSDILKSIEALRYLYQNLRDTILTINDQYFKTPPDRRKPIVRDLIRRFSQIASNNMSSSILTLTPSLLKEKYDIKLTASPETIACYCDCINCLLPSELPKDECKSLIDMTTKAESTVKLLKKAR